MKFKLKLYNLLKKPYHIQNYAMQMDEIPQHKLVVFAGMTPFSKKAAHRFQAHGYRVMCLDMMEEGTFDGIPVARELPLAEDCLVIYASRPFLAQYIEKVRKFCGGGRLLSKAVDYRDRI